MMVVNACVTFQSWANRALRVGTFDGRRRPIDATLRRRSVVFIGIARHAALACNCASNTVAYTETNLFSFSLHFSPPFVSPSLPFPQFILSSLFPLPPLLILSLVAPQSFHKNSTFRSTSGNVRPKECCKTPRLNIRFCYKIDAAAT